ncbi:MAG: cobalamin adenosyltransferase [Niameybacter sp.]
MSVLTEEAIRIMLAHHELKEKDALYLEPKQIVTPAARAYLMEKGITVKVKSEADEPRPKSHQPSTQEEVALRDTNKKDEKTMTIPEETYETLFGATLTQKPEHMTHLRGNVLVFKDHPRIALRGAIDSLESEILVVQVIADKQGLKQLIKDLEEVVRFIRHLLRCEVSGEPVGEFNLQGLSAEELREHSHHPSQYYGMRHFLPNYKQGEIVVYLNKLRALTREAELVAYKAFSNEYGQVEREDIIKAFNRLSSLFWIMMFKYLTDRYKES